MANKKTLVLGASNNPSRYSFKAINLLRANQHDVLAIGKSGGKVLDVSIKNSVEKIKDVDTITIYLNPSNQVEYFNFITTLKPKRVIFNPGSENAPFANHLRENGIEPIFACTLVMLNTGQY